MRKAIFAIFTLLIIFIVFSFNALEVRASEIECQYKPDSMNVTFIVKLVDGKVAEAKGEPSGWGVGISSDSTTYTNCPNILYTKCMPTRAACSLAFTAYTDCPSGYNCPEVSLTSTNNAPDPNSGNNNSGNNNSANPVTPTVLEYVGCGNVNVPKLLPNLIRFVVMLIQIVTPLILIFMGMLDFTKATAGSDEKEITKAKEKFVKRLVAAAMVFLAVTIIKFAVGVMAIDNEASVMKCVDCLISSEQSCG